MSCSVRAQPRITSGGPSKSGGCYVSNDSLQRIRLHRLRALGLAPQRIWKDTHSLTQSPRPPNHSWPCSRSSFADGHREYSHCQGAVRLFINIRAVPGPLISRRIHCRNYRPAFTVQSLRDFDLADENWRRRRKDSPSPLDSPHEKDCCYYRQRAQPFSGVVSVAVDLCCHRSNKGENPLDTPASTVTPLTSLGPRSLHSIIDINVHRQRPLTDECCVLRLVPGVVNSSSKSPTFQRACFSLALFFPLDI